MQTDLSVTRAQSVRGFFLVRYPFLIYVKNPLFSFKLYYRSTFIGSYRLTDYLPLTIICTNDKLQSYLKSNHAPIDIIQMKPNIKIPALT